jgi:hypothetical protein
VTEKTVVRPLSKTDFRHAFGLGQHSSFISSVVKPSSKWLVRLLGRLANGHFLVRHGRIASATARKSSPGPYGLSAIFHKELRKRNEK